MVGAHINIYTTPSFFITECNILEEKNEKGQVNVDHGKSM